MVWAQTYTSKATDRRSFSGGVVMCAGAYVSFFCRTHNIVALSSIEAELRYVAMADGYSKEADVRCYLWRSIFQKMDVRCVLRKENN